jgi:hypothetical protein
LFGWVAAETALLTKNILPLMMFHCFFDFFTYQMLATGNALILIYAVRGSLMKVVAVYLLYKLKHHSGDNVAGRSSRAAWSRRSQGYTHLTADRDRGAFGTIEADSRIPGPLGRNKMMLAGALCLTTAQLFAGSAGWQTWCCSADALFEG